MAGRNTFDLEPLHHEVARHARRLGPDEREALRTILWDDLASEYDARFYTAYVDALPIVFTPGFEEVNAEWRRDEDVHHAWTRCAYRAAFGWTGGEQAKLQSRQPDFSGIAHLFRDEFHIVCLGCYDELATVRAYSKSLPRYALLGPRYRAVMARIIADEARHYRNYLALIEAQHAHRAVEGPAVVAAIRATEGVGYGATFVLDHDDDVWDESIFDDSARILAEQLARLARLQPAA